MEQLAVKALVVKESDFGDFDKLLTLVTEENGKMTVTVKGGKSLKSRFVAACEPFTYAVFNIRRTNKYFYLYDFELIEDFYPIRDSIEKFSLASYICDVASEASLEGACDPDVLKLTLNALWALSYKEISLSLLKGAFEFKTAVICGFMPDLSVCEVCRSEKELLYIDVRGGRLVCDDCLRLGHLKNGLSEASVLLSVSPAVLDALRYISESPINRFLSFRLCAEEMPQFSAACEKYLINHFEHEFYTLSFYKTVVDGDI